MKLNVYYDSETDTLSLWNGQPASAGADVAENLTVDLDAEGEAVGFTLDHASEILKEIGARPFLAWNPKNQPPEGAFAWAVPFLVGNPEGQNPDGSPAWAHPFLVGNPEGLTLEDSERSAEMLKAVGSGTFIVGNPEGMMLEDNERSPEMLKAVGTHPFLIWNPQGLTPEDNQRKTEMLKAVGGHQVIVLNPEGLTPEDIEKLAIRSTVWVGQSGHLVDSGKK